MLEEGSFYHMHFLNNERSSFIFILFFSLTIHVTLALRRKKQIWVEIGKRFSTYPQWIKILRNKVYV